MGDGYRCSLIAVLALLVGIGCATAPEQSMSKPFEFDEQAPSSQAFADWIDGQPPGVEAPASAEEHLLVAEASYWAGDLEDAYLRYVNMLHEFPGHGLNRYAAHRLYRLRHDVVDFTERMAADLEGLRYDDEAALTRLELSRIAREVARIQWQRSDSEEPFFFAEGGATIDTWTATPMLSPWRLSDFDEPMAPEDTDRLSATYKSPLMASADPANWEKSQVVSVQRPRQGFDLDRRGIYYLESQLELDGDSPRDFTISGRFPGAAKVWIDGQQVFDRREEAYEPGRLLRPITLEPGEHRVLVKLAYEPGSRHWFELFFVPTRGDVRADTGLRSQPRVDGVQAGINLQGPVFWAEELEPVRLDSRDPARASGPTLFLAAMSAYASGDSEAFSTVWEPLMERHPGFVAGHLLGSYQVRTRWDLPTEHRDSRSISRLRAAQQADPDNLHTLVQLERALRDQGPEREHRQILERAKKLAAADDGAVATGTPTVLVPVEEDTGGRAGDEYRRGDELRLRQLAPFEAWAQYLQTQRWSEDAEQAWQKVLDIDARQCTAARRLQRLYRARHHFAAPEQITAYAHSCTSVVDRWLKDHPDRLEERIEFVGRQGARFPYNANWQTEYAEALRALDRNEEAVDVLESAIERMPGQRDLWRSRIEFATASGDEEQLRAILDEATRNVGHSAEWEWKRARLGDVVPLEGLLRDGRQAALEEVERTGDGDDIDEDRQSDGAMVMDDAYYVVDFAGRQYFEDGSSWTLTHQVIRVMTRGAISDYAELSVPRGAQLLTARTIKEDGEVRMPEGVSGDSTLSMPGLAEGDMIEVAYLQFRRSPEVSTHLEGNRFYFEMPTVSSRHSEYVVVGTESMEFESANGAPEPETFEYDGAEAMRFVARDRRRPRSQPRRVPAVEYLPWVREIRVGVDGHVLDVERRYMKETLAGSVRPAPAVNAKIESWLGRSLEDSTAATDDEIHSLYYGITDWFRDASPGSFSTQATHAIERRRGSPLVVMHLALRQLGVEHDVYVARSDDQPIVEQRVGEISYYRQPLLRVVMPDTREVVWLEMGSRDAMFGAVAAKNNDQQAICVTCDDFASHRVSMNDDRRPRRHVELNADLDEEGMLGGTLRYEFRGNRAVRVRAALRNRSAEEDRRDYFERVLTDQLSGANLVEFSIDGEADPDRPLVFEMVFERPGFARSGDHGLVVDRPLFQEAMQRIYARQSSRTIALMVGYEREQTYSATIGLPAGMEAELRADDVAESDSAFGFYGRQSWVEADTFRLESAIHLSRQRVSADDYDDFRQWTRTVEDSGVLWLGLSR